MNDYANKNHLQEYVIICIDNMHFVTAEIDKHIPTQSGYEYAIDYLTRTYRVTRQQAATYINNLPSSK